MSPQRGLISHKPCISRWSFFMCDKYFKVFFDFHCQINSNSLSFHTFSFTLLLFLVDYYLFFSVPSGLRCELFLVNDMIIKKCNFLALQFYVSWAHPKSMKWAKMKILSHCKREFYFQSSLWAATALKTRCYSILLYIYIHMWYINMLNALAFQSVEVQRKEIQRWSYANA